MRRPLLFVVLVLLAATSCRPSLRVATPMGSARDLILAPEMANARVTDAYQAVAQLRPEFLRRRGAIVGVPSRRVGLRVYLDDTEMGGVDILRTIPIDQVTAIRYLSASEASFRWGANHADGVILVSTARTLR